MEARRALLVASALGLVAVPAVRRLRRPRSVAWAPPAEPPSPALEPDLGFLTEWRPTPKPVLRPVNIHADLAYENLDSEPETATVPTAVATLDPPVVAHADVISLEQPTVHWLRLAPPPAEFSARPVVVPTRPVIPAPSEVPWQPHRTPRRRLSRVRRSIARHVPVWAAVVLVTVVALVVIVVAPSVWHSFNGVWERIVRGLGI